MPLPAYVTSALLDALAVLVPVECAGCGIPDRSVCGACLGALLGPPIRTPLPGLDLVSAVRYEGVARNLLLAFKENGRTDAARAIAAALRALLPADLELVAVPTSSEAYRRRGYDPVAMLLGKAGLRSSRVLQGARATSTQKKLDLAGREENRIGALRATGALHPRSFVIVDDVVTTGATILEAARAIRAAGGSVEGAVSFAWTPRRTPRTFS
jgi:predicted amidophosphoribosyltransferase